MLETPVAFLIFNRPDTTARVFAEIARVKPKKLLVVADGPRPDRSGEAEKCAEVRAIIDQVDWDCEVLKNYSDINIGCKYRVSSGLNWVFDQCQEAIIIEDDCLPHPTFFQFCTELLDKYRYDERIMVISGDNFQFGRKRGNYSYYFSRYAHIWGWASWRRAWSHNDIELEKWTDLRQTDWLNNILNDTEAVTYWRETFDNSAADKIDSWGIPWMFSCWASNGLTVLPNTNLVSNIGFGKNAVHTHTDLYGTANMKVETMQFPLKHPIRVLPDRDADRFTFNQIFAKEVYRPALWRRMVKNVLIKTPSFVQKFIYKIRTI